MSYKRVDRVVKSSERLTPTLEFDQEPGVFYIPHGGHTMSVAVSGPFQNDDARFRLATEQESKDHGTAADKEWAQVNSNGHGLPLHRRELDKPFTRP